MMSLEDLAVFVAVAEAESFVEASRRARIPASTVSRAVARLEEELGVRLLQRTSRNVSLTDEGRHLLLRAGPSVEELQQALGAISDRRAEPSGVVRITAPAFTGATRVARSLAAFAMEHPQIAIELEASNVMRDLIEDRFDLAIRVGPLADAELVTRRLWDGEFGLFASRDLVKRALGGRQRIGRAALERLPAVVTRATGKWRFRDRKNAIVTVTPNARFTVNDPRAAIEVARRGVGVVLAPAEAALEARELVRITTTVGVPEPAKLYAVYPSRRLLPARVRLVVEWLAKSDAS